MQHSIVLEKGGAPPCPPSSGTSAAPLIPFERYSKLSTEGKSAWNSIPAEDRRLILSGNSSAPSAAPTPPSTSCQVRMHTVSDFGHPDMFKGSDAGDNEAMINTAASDDADDTASTLLAHATQQHPHAADLCCMMSTPSTKSTSKSSTKPTTHAHAQEMVINGKTWHQVDVHIIHKDAH